jgi:tRNA-dependent cyclodipeptide synthase
MSAPHARIKVYGADGYARSDLGRAYVGVSLNDRADYMQKLLLPTCAWAESEFGNYTLLVGDYLHRHNVEMLLGTAPNEAVERAMSQGAAVAAEVLRAVPARLSAVPEILSARDQYDDPSFKARLAKFRRCHETDERFVLLVQRGVHAFLSRKNKGLLDSDAAWGHCISYQLEELAIFELLADMGYSTLIYPGQHLPLLIGFVSGQFPAVSPALETMTLVELTLH